MVSVQAMPSEPLYLEKCMVAMMKSVVKGGAGGLRVAGARDVKNAKHLFDIPVIGLTKPDVIPPNWQEIVYITPTLDDVIELVKAGADIIAFDGTMRERPNGAKLEDLIKYIKINKRVSMADISTVEEGINAAKLGANMLSTTLSGYTQFSKTEEKVLILNFWSSLLKKQIFLLCLKAEFGSRKKLTKRLSWGRIVLLSVLLLQDRN